MSDKTGYIDNGVEGCSQYEKGTADLISNGFGEG